MAGPVLVAVGVSVLLLVVFLSKLKPFATRPKLTCPRDHDMFAGGTETAATALNWAMAQLVQSPRVMAKAQDEDKLKEFRPERFENNNINFKGTDFESGRRICTGITQGLVSIEVILATLLYHFDWKLPTGTKPKDVDMSDAPRIVSTKRTRLFVHPVTRIPPNSD
uniref:Cytochrome P450 n=1 Tax=Oryza brachyantha TaxID=4533 RepID=J3KUQ5_ORYBR